MCLLRNRYNKAGVYRTVPTLSRQTPVFHTILGQTSPEVKPGSLPVTRLCAAYRFAALAFVEHEFVNLAGIFGR